MLEHQLGGAVGFALAALSSTGLMLICWFCLVTIGPELQGQVRRKELSSLLRLNSTEGSHNQD